MKLRVVLTLLLWISISTNLWFVMFALKSFTSSILLQLIGAISLVCLVVLVLIRMMQHSYEVYDREPWL